MMQRHPPEFLPSRCESLEDALELYAEGELRGPVRVEEVRAHLEVCGACRDRLDGHDLLTASILGDEGPAPVARARVDRIMTAVSALPPRFSSAFIAASLGEGPATEAPATRRLFLSWPLRLAAALALAALGLLVAGRWRDSAEAPGVDSSLAAMSSRVQRYSAPSSPQRAALQWFASPGHGAPRGATAPLLILHGYRDVAEPAANEAIQPEWIVEASASRRSPFDDRYFLIPDDAEETLEGAQEFDPLRWSSARGYELSVSPQATAGTRPCRIFVIHGVSTLGGQSLPPAPTLQQLLGPEPPGRQSSPWLRPVGVRS